MINIFIKYLSFMFIVILLQGCIPQDHIISRPLIESNPEWEMVESCGYEGCRPMVDFLSTKDIRIRIEAFNNQRKPNLFVVDIAFVGIDFYNLKSSEYDFDTSLITVMLSNGKVLEPKVFTCSYTIWDLKHLRSKPSLKGQIPIIDDNRCLTLFFDYPPPSVEEEFTMDLNGLKRNGNSVEIPTVFFKKGISRY